MNNKVNTNDLKDLQKFIKENKKWYWFVPIIGYFISMSKIKHFTESKGMSISSNEIGNAEYSYTLSDAMSERYYSDGYRLAMTKMMRIHSLTLFISMILLIAFEIFIFNVAFLIFNKVSNGIIKNNSL